MAFTALADGAKCEQPPGSAAEYVRTHGTYKLLIQLKCHQGIRQVPEPLLENARNDMNVVVIQINAVHICTTTGSSDKPKNTT